MQTIIEFLNQPAACLPDKCFCEALNSGHILQPVDAFSSLALCLAGIILLWSRPQNWFSKLFAGILIFVGLGSFYYHAQLTFLSQILDNIGMYFVALLPIVLILKYLRNLSSKQTAALFTILGLIMLALAMIYQGARRYELAFLIVVLLWLDLKYGRRVGIQSRSYLYTALAVFIVSFAFWVADLTKALCQPDLWLQGHAIWHILNALVAFCLFLHYRQIATAHTNW